MQTKKRSEEELLKALTAIATSGGGSKVASNPHLLQLQDVQGLTLVDVIGKCLDEKKLVSFKVAKAAALATPGVAEGFTAGSFRNVVDIPKLTQMFATVVDGADALLVNERGNHSAKVIERHEEWLLEHGFDAVMTFRLEQRKAELEKLQASVAAQEPAKPRKRKAS